MLTQTHFSINWGKGFAILLLTTIMALTLISLATLSHGMVPSAIGVDWGSRSVPACPPGVKDCKVAVDWGSFTAPCPPTDPSCGSGPVAVDWGDSYSTYPTFDPPVDQVAVDWGDSYSMFPPPPCKPTDPKCKPGIVPMVDWGS